MFGCGPEETARFREMAPRLGVTATLTRAEVSEAASELARGTRCVSVSHRAVVGRSVLQSLRRVGVRHLSTRSVGQDHIDEPCARRLGISVEAVHYSPDSVADYTVLLILMAVRHAKATLLGARPHDDRSGHAPGRELRDLTVGVVGTGRIGGAVIDRLGGFGCRILANDRRPTRAGPYVTLDELLTRSDVVTLHTPLTGETRHLLDRRRLALLPAGAIVVNTGRGALVETEALLSALERGHLGGAALDVVEGEGAAVAADGPGATAPPPLVARLQQLPNVLVTPHTAYFTEHALADLVDGTLSRCLRFERAVPWAG